MSLFDPAPVGATVNSQGCQPLEAAAGRTTPRTGRGVRHRRPFGAKYMGYGVGFLPRGSCPWLLTAAPPGLNAAALPLRRLRPRLPHAAYGGLRGRLRWSLLDSPLTFPDRTGPGPGESPGRSCSGRPARACSGSPHGSPRRGCTSCRPGAPEKGPPQGPGPVGFVSLPRRVLPVAIRTPLPHVALHVVQTQRVRLVFTHRRRLIAVEVRLERRQRCAVADSEGKRRRTPSSTRVFPFRLGRQAVQQSILRLFGQLSRKSSASVALTVSTGRFGPLKLLGFCPVTASY